MWVWWVASALAAPASLVVRVADQHSRLLQAPSLRLTTATGEQTIPLLDDGTDPADLFAGDRLWVGRLPLDATGAGELALVDTRLGVLKTLHQQSVRLGAVDQVLQLDTRRLDTPVVEVPTAAPVLDAAPAEPPADFPVPPVVRAESVFQVPLRWPGRWVSTMVALGLGIALAVALRRPGWERSGPPSRDRRVEGLVSLGGMALLLFIWAPALPALAHSFLGVEYVDHYGTQWFYWFVEQGLEKASNPGFTDLFFFPWGKDIYGHTGANVLDAYLAIPFRGLLGPVLGYNVFVLLGLVVSAVAFYRLTARFSADGLSRLLATILFSLMPVILFEVNEGRPTQAITLFVVLFFDALLQVHRRVGWRLPVWGGICLALAGYQYWFYALFAGAAAAFYGIWRLWDPGEAPDGRRGVLLRLVGMALVAVLLVGPVALPMVLASGGDKVPGLIDVSLWSWASTPPITAEGHRVAFFSWQPFVNVLGFMTIDADGVERFIPSGSPIPWPWLLLALIGLLRPAGRERGGLLAMVGILTLLAVGPTLLVLNRGLPNPLYIELLRALPFLRRLWWPARASLVMVVPISLLALYGLGWVRAQSRRVQGALLAGLLLWWTVDLRRFGVGPLQTWDATVPAGYRCLAAATEGAVIEMPFGWTQAHLYYQTVHHRPILGGMLEDNPTFTPAELVDLRGRNRMVAQLLNYNATAAEFRWPSTDQDEMKDLGYRWVVFQKDAWAVNDPSAMARIASLEEMLAGRLGKPVYDDGRIGIYAPWGDSLDCSLEVTEMDYVPLGRTEFLPDDEGLSPEKLLFTRLFVEPPPVD